jgi:hypothetical protein
LEALDLPAISYEYDDCVEDRVDVESTMIRLFQSLHPLVELGIVGAGITAFEAILKRHGGKLQVFCVEKFILSLQQVEQLRESCPRIRELGIEILRSAGDHVEVETYRTLGSMRNLKSLSLLLQHTDYCHEDEPDEPGLLWPPPDDEEDREAMAIAIRQVFVNAAVDESLARSIFHQMLAAHTSIKAGLPPRLSYIRLQVGRARPVNGREMCMDFKGVLGWIGRSWVCRRDPRDTHQSDVTVEEVDVDIRLRNGERLDDEMDELFPNEECADAWKALWPDTGAGWKEEWQSFPLASDVY